MFFTVVFLAYPSYSVSYRINVVCPTVHVVFSFSENNQVTLYYTVILFIQWPSLGVNSVSDSNPGMPADSFEDEASEL